ncbi:autotransporter outer membrane beta-barrel domain-containing protein [Roseibium sp. Sym1]|uniref:autotransporter outer membrane beta-barrel domain-containing protein n=1 Tax=Roseibium sp. Sym1 TaxID=3016006 RepID=UPI0022B4B9B4|nr:autotransporter domain-containing protein [Roseibium sp. Sym1]
MVPAYLKNTYYRDVTTGRSFQHGLKHLLATTALTMMVPHFAQAQVVIDGSTETVDGGGGGTQASPWNVGDALTVGDTGTGALEVSNGGVVTSGEGRLGNASTGDGTVSVDGAGTDWSLSGQLFVGYEGTGAMTISASGTVSSTSASTIAFGTDSTGTLTVTNSGTLNTVGALYVSEGGTGYLTVSAGGTVSVTNTGAQIRIANDAGSYGEATVTGSGSSLEAATNGTLFAGYSGTGVLNIQDMANVEADGGYIGYYGTAVGTVNVDTGGSVNLASTGTDLTIGYQAGSEGTLNIDDGTVDVGDLTTLGDLSGSNGTLNVSGGSGQFETRRFYVGDAGTGVVDISGGASAEAEVIMTVGVQAGSMGTVINDNGSLIVGSTFTIGDAGTGSVTIRNGGDLSVTGYTYVGDDGTGTLTLSDGATATLADELLIGDGTSGDGTVTVDNAQLDAGNILVGNEGTGTMTISGGGTVNAEDVVIGNAAASNGTMTVTETGSNLNLSVELNVGLDGTGTLNVTDGGGINLSDWIRLGTGTTGVGSMTVDGAGSQITNTADTIVGDDGEGSLALSDGAQFSGDGELYIGYAATSTGTLSIKSGAQLSVDTAYMGWIAGSSASATVDGTGSSWTNTYDLYVGHQGTGDLTVSNGASVSNAVAYIGYDSSAVGTVAVDGSGSSWMNGSNVYVGENGSGTLTISNGGDVSVGGPGTLVLGNLAGSTGTLNIGAASGDPAVGAGTLDAAMVEFGAGTGLIVFNHTDTDYQFDAEISGPGNVMVYGGETVLTADNTYTGATGVHDGLLTVNGSITGTVTLLGGALGGSGTVGNVAVQSGSSLAPGNSVGTLNVAGMMFGSGASYDVELNDGGFVAGTNNDLVNASGAVVIAGGTVNVLPENGTDTGSTYEEGTYTIITAAGGLSGTFDSVSESFVFLDFALGYDSNNVYLNSEKVVFFTDITETANQTAVAAAQEALGSGTTVYDALTGLVGDDSAARAAFDALSGELHPSARTALIEDSRQIRETVNARVRRAFDNLVPAGIATHSGGNTPDTGSGGGRYALWGHAYGAVGTQDGDGNAAALDRTVGGILFGADHEIGDAVRVGLLAGYSRANLDVDARNSSGSVDGYHLGVYGGTRLGAIGLRGGSVYTWNRLDTDRTVAFTGFNETLGATYDAQTFQAFAEAGYDIDLGRARLEPYAGLAYVHLQTDGFTETGGSAALSVSGSTTGTAFTTLGLRGETDVTFGPSITARLGGGLTWYHAFGDLASSTQMAFSGGTPFAITGVPVGRDSVLLDLDADVLLTPSASAGLAYSGQIGDGFGEHGLKARLAVSF